ncbi:3-methyladenine DNA glycosylase [Marmoricola endophyticus]|uniref:3-methyladenine DNA glycosylase n=1 Tax=Marmoricola endophyticus TaxID=2040280 RepID=A0A917F0M6_9ACTN|nr:DNA-3-methyladenine glycosylase 2 family protein [Marmoricola endophyticus]GGF33019.1 3-methyladenine DNA glycosylase [Marmoricola endophyticus]
MQERVWRVERPVPVAQILGILRRGRGDPTYKTTPDGAVWRGIGAPTGPATLRVSATPAHGEVHGRAWGPGAEWVLDRLPTMLGDTDDVSGFEPRHAVLVDAHRRHPHWRLTRTERVMEALTPAIIEQKVTGQEAFAGFRRLCFRFGERAPGEGADVGLWVQPGATTIRGIASWEWLRMHVDPARSRALVNAARYAANLERTLELGVEEADRRLRALPGIGVWTSAEVRFRAHGDADAVSFGDYHVGKNIIWALTGEHVDVEDGLAELLEPWAGHRHRVQRLVEFARLGRPRHGPRMAPRTHLPVR